MPLHSIIGRRPCKQPNLAQLVRDDHGVHVDVEADSDLVNDLADLLVLGLVADLLQAHVDLDALQVRQLVLRDLTGQFGEMEHVVLPVHVVEFFHLLDSVGLLRIFGHQVDL